MNRSILATILFLLLIASLTVSPQRVRAVGTSLRLDPPNVIDETLTPGETVVMTVQATDVQNLYAYEFKIYFNNTVLNVTRAVRPAGHFLEPSDPANQFIPKWEIRNDFNATHGRVWLSFTLLYPETSRSGSGVLAEMDLAILNVGSTVLAFGEALLADDTGGSIAHEDVNGFFNNSPAPSPPPSMTAHVYVDPPDIVDPMLTPSSNFTIHVGIVNSTDVYSFELKLSYDPSTLKALGLIEGSFLENANLTFSVVTIDNTAGFVILNSTLTSLPTVSGEGDLAIIDFNVLKTGSTSLTISEFVLRNSTGQALNATITDGHFSNITLEGDVNGDGIVDVLDLNAVATAFGATPDNPRWNPSADLNSDGIINVIDLVLVMVNLGSVIPEYPSYLLLVFMIATAALATAAFRKRRAVNLRI